MCVFSGLTGVNLSEPHITKLVTGKYVDVVPWFPFTLISYTLVGT